MKLFLFDVDATLLKAGGAGKLAFNRCFEDLFNEKEIWQKYDPSGLTDLIIIEDLFKNRFDKLPTQKQIEDISKSYTKHLEKTLYEVEAFEVLPFAKELLEALHKRKDVILGLCTGNYKETAFLKLKRAALDSYFTFGGFGCDSKIREELTQKAKERGLQKASKPITDVYVVGDTIHDMRCAKHIEAIGVGVLTGYASATDLIQAHAKIVIHHLGEFPDI